MRKKLLFGLIAGFIIMNMSFIPVIPAERVPEGEIESSPIQYIQSTNSDGDDGADGDGNSGQTYAVIMIGTYLPHLNTTISSWGAPDWPNLAILSQYYQWYLNDAGRLYTMFNETYGIPETNIYILAKEYPVITTYDDQVFFEVPDTFNLDWIRGESDEATLAGVLQNIGNIMTDDDTLIYTQICHGYTPKTGVNTGQSFFGSPLFNIQDVIFYLTYILPYLNIPGIDTVAKLLDFFGIEGPRIYDYELESMIDTYINNYKNMIFVLQPCHSGGFIEELSGSNRVILTSCRINQSADSWIGHVRAALNSEVDADYDGNGRISFREAYEYAANVVTSNYDDQFHPLIDDNADGIGIHYLEAGYQPDVEGMDGYLASSIYITNYNIGVSTSDYDDLLEPIVELLSEPPSTTCSNVYEDGCPLFNLALVKSDMTICHYANIGQLADVTDIVIKAWASSTGGLLQAQYADEGPPQEVPIGGTIGDDDDASDITQTTSTTINSQPSPQLQTNDDIETSGPFTTSSTQTSQSCGPLNYLLLANPIGCASISGYRGVLNVGTVEYPILTINPTDFEPGQHTIGITYDVWAEYGTYGGSTITGIATCGADPALCDLVIVFTV